MLIIKTCMIQDFTCILPKLWLFYPELKPGPHIWVYKFQNIDLSKTRIGFIFEKVQQIEDLKLEINF